MKIVAYLGKTPDGHDCVLTDATYTPYVVCSNYDENLPDGQKWDHGHYFQTLTQMAEYITQKERDERLIARLVSEGFDLSDDFGEILGEICEDFDLTKEDCERFSISEKLPWLDLDI